MKKLLLISLLSLPIAGFAQEDENSFVAEGVYSLYVSPNGQWFGSRAGDASIYDFKDRSYIYYDECFFGLGNTIADNGMAVGEMHDTGVLMYQGNMIFPPTLSKYWFCDLNAITPDASRLTGLFNNTDRNGVYYVPFVADIAADGTVGEPIPLPYPKKDLFGAPPQFVTAVWISSDGHTVIGQVLDWRGMYSYPICYTEDENGEWSYSLPSESLFNPNHIELPENPWLSEYPFPEPEDFMSGLLRNDYLEAYDRFISGLGSEPNPYNYMSEEEIEEYEEAVEKYNEWFEANKGLMNEYHKIYLQVLQTSPSFSANDMALHPSGEYFMMHGGVENQEGDMIGTIYQFTKDGEISIVNAPDGSYFPAQILPDNTLIVARGMAAGPASYIRLAGSEEFITLEEYLETSHPELATWVSTLCANGQGRLCVNDDMTVFSNALVAEQLFGYDGETDYYYNTMFIELAQAGIESIINVEDTDIYKVYNLQGVKVLETKDFSALNSLKGLYVINGKKVMLK